MIKCKLAVLMAERGLKIIDVSRETGITRNTLSTLYNNTSKGIQFETLDKLCSFFNILPGDLFSYIGFNFEFDIKNEFIDKGQYDFNVSFSFEDKNIQGIVSIIIDMNNSILECPEDVRSISLTIEYPNRLKHDLSIIPEKYIEDEFESTLIDYVLEALNLITIESLSIRRSIQN